jgi:hypothetical protein
MSEFGPGTIQPHDQYIHWFREGAVPHNWHAVPDVAVLVDGQNGSVMAVVVNVRENGVPRACGVGTIPGALAALRRSR